MLIWKNTSTLDGYDDGLLFTEDKSKAEIVLLGGKSIDINEFQNLKGVFRAGVGKDNVPELEANNRNIEIGYPSKKTINIIYEETSSFTCGLILRMMYSNIGTLNTWTKEPRTKISKKTLLIIGKGNIGGLVEKLMKPFMNVVTYDILENKESELKSLISIADYITLHLPKNNDGTAFIDSQKLSWMKDGSSLINTSRGSIVDENSIYKEIKSGRIKAAFDVYWTEPYLGKLKEFHPDSFYMTPHVASTCADFLIGCNQDLKLFISSLNK